MSRNPKDNVRIYTSIEELSKLYIVAKEILKPPISMMYDLLKNQTELYPENFIKNSPYISMPVIKSIPDIFLQLAKQYADKLLEDGYGFKRSALKKMDMIDMSDLHEKDEKTPIYPGIRLEDKEAFDQEEPEPFYSIIPCFEEGVIHITRNRYLYFKINSLDLDRRTMQIFLQDHIYDQNVWLPGISTTICYKQVEMRNKDRKTVPAIQADSEACASYTDIFRMIPPKQLKWNPAEQNTWKNTALKAAKRIDGILEDSKTELTDVLNFMFTNHIMYANFCLNHNRPKAIPMPDAENQTCQKKKEIREENDTPTVKTKRIRNVGPIRVTSVKTPKAPSPKSPPRYSVASWTVCGHTRRLRNGKLMYVKPKVHRRKCLQETESGEKPAQSVVRIRK